MSLPLLKESFKNRFYDNQSNDSPARFPSMSAEKVGSIRKLRTSQPEEALYSYNTLFTHLAFAG